MHVQARASIDLHGSVLRYAEVERYGARYRLLRLGSCDFDFDAEHELLNDSDPEHLDVIADAIRDVFEGSTAGHLHVALHPPAGFAFFTPLPAGLPADVRRARLELEATLLADADAPHALRLAADSVYTETLDDAQTVEWYHVLALPAVVQERFESALSAFSRAQRRFVTSMSGAATIVGQLEDRQGRGGAPPYTLAMGFYGPLVEFTLCHEGRWRFSHHARVEAPSDAVYYATSLLSRMGLSPRDVGRLALYGDMLDADAAMLLDAVFHLEAGRLNPMQVVDLDPGSLSSSFDAAAYAPAIGVAL